MTGSIQPGDAGGLPPRALVRCIGAIAVVVFVAAPDLSAQTGDTTRLLEPIVVTATRSPMPREAVTAQVTVFTGEDLRAAGVTSLVDALRVATGAVVQTGSWGGNAVLFLRGGEADFTRVLVDGVPVNEPGGAYSFADLPLDNVERIEIMRGPASVLYGSDAVSGVVQVFTRTGAGDPEASVAFRAGTHNTMEWKADAAAGGPAVSLSAGLRRFTTDGAYAFNNEYRNTAASARIVARPDEHTWADISARYVDAVFHFPTDGSGNLVDRNQHQLTETVTLGLELGRRLARGVEGRLVLGLHDVGGGIDDQPDDEDDNVGFFGYRSQRDLTRRSADARLDLTLARQTLITAGVAAEVERQRLADETLSEFGTFSSSSDARRTNRAVYAQITVGEAAPGLALNAGARLDDNERFGTFVTVRSGAGYRIPTGTRVHVSAGTGFKAPTFFEQHGSAFVVGDPDLRPERTASWEAGLEQAMATGRAVLQLTWFNQRFRNLIEFVGIPAEPGDPNYINVSAARADGVEVEFIARPVSALTLSAQYTRLITRVTESAGDAAFTPGERLLRRPGDAAVVRGSWRAFGRGTMSLAVRHTGSRDDLDWSVVDFVTVFAPERVTLPSYTVLDVAVDASITGPFALTARVENALDRRYEEVRGFPARGRTVMIGGRIRP